MKALILVRHGETTWSAEGRLQGQEDSPLSPEGRRQVELLAPLVARLQPTRVLSSDLQRAYDTSWLLEYPAPELDPRLREADLGDWTGRHTSDLRAEACKEYRAWRAGRYTPPNAEPWEQLRLRVDSVLTELQSFPGVTLVVTHCGPIRAACALLIGLQPAVIHPSAPASLTVITLDGRPRLAAFNLTGREPALLTPD
jgi:glucosyl-3-phosphoglycerate phosphatase